MESGQWSMGVSRKRILFFPIFSTSPVFTVFIWIRATLPRLRYDQLMSLGWRSLLPLAVTNFLVVALWIVCTEVYGAAGGWISVGAAVVVIFATFFGLARASRKSGYALEKREVLLVDPGKVAP